MLSLAPRSDRRPPGMFRIGKARWRFNVIQCLLGAPVTASHAQSMNCRLPATAGRAAGRIEPGGPTLCSVDVRSLFLRQSLTRVESRDQRCVTKSSLYQVRSPLSLAISPTRFRRPARNIASPHSPMCRMRFRKITRPPGCCKACAAWVLQILCPHNASNRILGQCCVHWNPLEPQLATQLRGHMSEAAVCLLLVFQSPPLSPGSRATPASLT